MYNVASPNPNSRGGGQLPNPNECNSTLTSGTSGGAAPTYTIYTGEGVNYLTLTRARAHAPPPPHD